MRDKGINILLVCCSSLLLAASFPKISWWFCAFFCIIPFFCAIERAGGFLDRLLIALAWTAAYVAFMAHWLFLALVGHYGVSASTAVLFSVLFVFIPLLVINVMFVFAYAELKSDSTFFYALIVPSLWVLMEYVKTRLPFLVPWIDIGYSALSFRPFVQVADLGGVYLVSFILVMINALLWRIIIAGYKAASERIGQSGRKAGSFVELWDRSLSACAILIVSAMVIPSGYGVFRLNSLKKEAKGLVGTGIEARVVQGNFSTRDRWSGMGLAHRLKTYIELSGKKGEIGEKRLIVWPETVLNESSMINDNLFAQLMKWFGPDTLLVSGGVCETGRAVYNSAYLVSGRGRLMRYDKHILLPYAEAVPPIDLLGRYYSAPEHYTPGGTPTAIRSPEAVVGVSICLEILYPGFVRSSVVDGAQLLVNISNDSWFGDSSMPYIHFSAARMRAIENRRYVVRASNSGISGIITPTGDVKTCIPLFVRKSAQAGIRMQNDRSIYVRFGNWMILLVLILLGIGSIRAVIQN